MRWVQQGPDEEHMRPAEPGGRELAGRHVQAIRNPGEYRPGEAAEPRPHLGRDLGPPPPGEGIQVRCHQKPHRVLDVVALNLGCEGGVEVLVTQSGEVLRHEEGAPALCDRPDGICVLGLGTFQQEILEGHDGKSPGFRISGRQGRT